MVSLSVVCHIRAPCLNHWADLDAMWQVHLWGPLTPQGKEGFQELHGVKRPAKACNCKFLMLPGEEKRGAIPLFSDYLGLVKHMPPATRRHKKVLQMAVAIALVS